MSRLPMAQIPSPHLILRFFEKTASKRLTIVIRAGVVEGERSIGSQDYLERHLHCMHRFFETVSEMLERLEFLEEPILQVVKYLLLKLLKKIINWWKHRLASKFQQELWKADNHPRIHELASRLSSPSWVDKYRHQKEIAGIANLVIKPDMNDDTPLEFKYKCYSIGVRILLEPRPGI